MKKVLAIAGSLRRGSYNRLLLRAAVDQAPCEMAIELYDELSSIPMFDEDLENQTTAGVVRLREAVAASDGLLIATPEFNWSIPGVLKNTLDWLSRAAPVELLAGRPIAIIGASGGRWGTRLAQAHLRQVLASTESAVLPAPAVFVREAERAFDENGNLVDGSTRRQLDALLDAFAHWMETVSKGVAHV